VEFGRRIGERIRLLWDTQQDEKSTRVCVNMMEDLVKELVLQQIPERRRNPVREK
jgi:hypothetical protein